MNVSQDYDDDVERLNTHPDLLPPAEDTEKLLKEDRAVLVKALTSKVLPKDTKTAAKANSPRVAPRGTVAPRNSIRPQVAPKNGIRPQKKAYQSYEDILSSFQQRAPPRTPKTLPSTASAPRERPVTLTSRETFPTRKTAARALTPRVVPPPQNYRRSVLGNIGNRVPSCKGGGDPPIECAREIQRDRASKFWRDREREFCKELQHLDLVLGHALRSHKRRNHTE
jgi:hypothetical protein